MTPTRTASQLRHRRRPRRARGPRRRRDAPDLRGPRRRHARVGHRGPGVPRLHRRHRRAEHRSSPSAGARGDTPSARRLHAHLLPGGQLRRLRRAVGAAERARRRRPEQDAAAHHRRRGHRERGQDRPRLHQPAGRHRLQRRLPRPHPVRAVAHRVEHRLQAELRAVRVRGLPHAVPLRVPRHQQRPRRWPACSTCSTRASRPAQVAAIIIEPQLGEGGFVPAPVEFLRELRRLCTAHGIVLIVDEIQTGFGRTGKMFAYEHYGIEPDLVTMAKSIGGGLPLSAVVGKAAIMDAPAVGGLGGTYAGNPVACAAAHRRARRVRGRARARPGGASGRDHRGRRCWR